MSIDYINEIAEKIANQFSVDFIYLYNRKTRVSDDKLKEFNIAVVIKEGNSKKTEKDIYLEVSSEIPFVCLCYNKEEWNNLLSDENSFVHRISKRGQLIYGQI
ncbi:MAG: hypothetical protein IKZ25_00710 [Clostridia bacterium]|nr:hypothetical protein [Clostridia bacterium]